MRRLLLLSLLCAPSALAQVTVRPVVEGALEIGGDDFLTVYFTNGTDQTVKAGQGGTLAVGAEVQPAALPLVVRGTVGFKFLGTAADNANIFFTRIPVEAVARYQHASGVHAGAGFTLHLLNKLNGDGFIPDRTFDPTGGPTVEVGWKWVSATYTWLTYTDGQGRTFDASAPGLSFVYRIER